MLVARSNAPNDSSANLAPTTAAKILPVKLRSLGPNLGGPIMSDQQSRPSGPHLVFSSPNPLPSLPPARTQRDEIFDRLHQRLQRLDAELLQAVEIVTLAIIRGTKGWA